MEEQNYNWSLANNVICKCGCEVFVQGVYIQRLSKLVAMTPKDVVRPVPTFCCALCGEIPEGFGNPSKPKMPDVSKIPTAQA